MFMILDFFGGPRPRPRWHARILVLIHTAYLDTGSAPPFARYRGLGRVCFGVFTCIRFVPRMPERVFRVRAPRRRGKSPLRMIFLRGFVPSCEISFELVSQASCGLR